MAEFFTLWIGTHMLTGILHTRGSLIALETKTALGKGTVDKMKIIKKNLHFLLES